MPAPKESGLQLLLLLVLVLVTGCKPDTMTDGEPGGEKIFDTYCKICHGVDGKLGLNGASDMAGSKLSQQELIDVITNGRNAMQPYDRVLSKEEIEAVAAHVMTLRTN